MPILTAWGIFFCLGLAIGFYIRGFLILKFISAALLILCSCLFIKEKNVSQAFLLAAALLLGVIRMSDASLLGKNSISHFITSRKIPASVSGIIVSEPDIRSKSSSFIINAYNLKAGGHNIGVSGNVMVKNNTKQIFCYGDEIEAQGNLFRPYYFSRGYELYLKRKDVYSILSCGRDGTIRRLAVNKANHVKYVLFFLKRCMENKIFSCMRSPEAYILDAVIFGRRSGIPRAIKTFMIKSGTWHVLVVSGLHTGLVAFIIFLVLKILMVRRAVRTCLTIILLAGYCIVSGASVSVLRATIMTIAVLAGFLFKRQSHVCNSLTLAALIILTFSPYEIFNPGFQFSFLSVFFIFWMYPKIFGMMPEILSRNRVSRFLIMSFSVSLSAWIGTLPVSLYHFGRAPLLGVPANMISVPLASLVVISGFFLLAACFVSVWFCAIFASASEFLIFLLLKINLIFSGLPFSSLDGRRITFAAVLGYYLLIILSVSFSCKKKYSQ